MSEELKPCPFCGGEAVKTNGTWSDDKGNNGFYVKCEHNCTAIMTNVVWNTRPLEAENTALETKCARYEKALENICNSGMTIFSGLGVHLPPSELREIARTALKESAPPAEEGGE